MTKRKLKDLKVNFSKGNIKVGRIPSVSLMPGNACSQEACETCYYDCYARRMTVFRPRIGEAWKRNTVYAITQLTLFEDDVNTYLDIKKPKYFRIHVGGDFVGISYINMWINVAKAHPDTHFLAFTKQYDMIRGFVFPENFQIVLSAWPGVSISSDLTDIYPIAWMQDGTETRIPKDAILCHGNCESCGMCWQLSKLGHDVYFHKH